MTVEIDVFSGRPNPRWTLTQQQTTHVEQLLRDLPSTSGPAASGLGFRGFILSEGDRRIRVGSGLVHFENETSNRVRGDEHGLEPYLQQLATEAGYGELVKGNRP